MRVQPACFVFLEWVRRTRQHSLLARVRWSGFPHRCFGHLIEKNYGSGLCQLEVEDLFAAFGDLARV